MNTFFCSTGWKAIVTAAFLATSAVAMQPGDVPPRGRPDGPGGGGPSPREPGPGGERDPGAGDRGPGLFEPGALKARLERRLEEVTREQVRLRKALERLGKGEPPEDIGRGLPMSRRPGRSVERRPEGGEGRGERPMDGPNGFRGDGPHAEGSPQEHEQLLALLHEAMPGLAAKVDEVSRIDPEAGRRMIAHWAPRLREAAELKRNDPELFDLRMNELRQGWTVIEASRAARELSRPSHDKDDGIEDKRAKSRGDLKEALARQFDARLAMQSHEVSALEKRLAELKSHLEEQRAARETRISETLDRILKDKDLPLEPSEPRDRPPHPKR